MSESSPSSHRFDSYLAQIETLERKRRRRYQFAALAGLLLLALGAIFLFTLNEAPAPSRLYQAESLTIAQVEEIFQKDIGHIVVAHPAIGADTIRSPEDYRSFRGVLETLARQQAATPRDSLSREAAVPPPAVVDVAGARLAGEPLVFTIEDYQDSLTYELHLGNGIIRKGLRQVTYTYPRPGTFRMRLIATNQQGGSSLYTKTIIIGSGSSLYVQAPASTANTISESEAESVKVVAAPGPRTLARLAGSVAGLGGANDLDARAGTDPLAIPELRGEALPAHRTPDGSLEAPLIGAEVMPSFPGGVAALGAFVRTHYRYPREAQTREVEGVVHVRFVVQADGQVTDPQVIYGIGGGCDEEAIRLVNMMPPWVPGAQNGENVAVYQTIPINFRLVR